MNEENTPYLKMKPGQTLEVIEVLPKSFFRIKLLGGNYEHRI
jgi:hypothetical protein